MNGLIGTAPDNQDGLLGLVVLGATAVSTTFVLGTPYRLVRPEDLTALGITATNNARIVELVKQFYAEAEEGTPVYLIGFEATSMTSVLDVDNGPMKGVLQALRGALRGLIVASASTATVTVEDGLDPDVLTAMPKAQALADWAADNIYAPVFVILEGRHFTSAADAPDLTALTYNRVGVFIGDTVKSSINACVGTLAGRIAASPVQRNIGRVASGALAPVEMFIGDAPVDQAMSVVDALYAKGYICPRIYVGLSGFYFVDDSLATAKTDDYAHLTARRTIDKSARIAYLTMLQFMLDDIELNTDGTMQQPVLKDWQAQVERAINTQMSAAGELSVVDGSGCKFWINPKQNVLTTSKVEGTLKVRPFGYSREIIVNIGFLTQNS
nr:DUF2586 family protein [Oscillospiraceae bacterium]